MSRTGFPSVVLPLGLALLSSGAAGCRGKAPVERNAAESTATLLVDGREAGTAFVAEKLGDSVWLATDSRVVPDGAKVGARFGAGGTLSAEPVWRGDAEGLAILRVDAIGLPRALRPPVSAPRESEARGLLVAPGRAPIPVTVFEASTALAVPGKGEAREKPRLRLSGPLDPSCTGAPVVSTEGRLLGVASIASPEAASLVPVGTLTDVLSGRVARFEVRELSFAPGSATLEAEVWLFDPRGAVKEASFQLRSRTYHPNPPVPTPGEESYLTHGAFSATAKIPLTDGHGRVLVRAKGSTNEEEQWAELYFEKAGRGYVFAVPIGMTVHFSGDTRRAAPDADKGGGEVAAPLPSPATAFHAAAGGKLVVLALEGSDTLKVWETSSRRFVRDIRLPSPSFVLGVGGETAIVYFPENALLATYDLTTGERRLVVPNPLPGAVVRLWMGAGNGERAVARVRISEGSGRQTASFLLDARTLTPLPSASAPLRFADQRHPDYPPRTLCDSSLTRLTEWIEGLSPGGVGAWVITGPTARHLYVHDSKGWLSPGDDGRIYTRGGEILDGDLKVEAKVPERKLLAGCGGVFYLGIGTDGGLDLYVSGQTTSVAYLGKHPGKASETTTLLLGSEGKLVLLGEGERSLVQRDFDVTAALSAVR